MLETVERRGAGAAVVTGDQYDVGVSLGYAGRHRADADLGYQLDVDPGVRIRILQIVDELGQILD